MESDSKLLVSAIVAFSLLLNSVDAHTMGMGACPRLQPMKSFNLDKFKGVWFVIQKFSTSSSCLKYNFADGSDGKLRIVQSSQHYVLDSVGVDDFTYTGVLTFPDKANDPARMKVKFPLNVAGEADYMVYKTDYDNYGVVYSCQKILVGHTKSMSILSRKPTLENEVLSEIRQQISAEGLDVSDFSKIDQSKCADSGEGNGSFKVKIDDKTFSSGTIVDAAKKVGETVSSGFNRAAEVLVPGHNKSTDITMEGAS